MTVTIGVVEDHSEFRQSLVFLISSLSEFHVEWDSASAEEALTKSSGPDVMLLDINLPGMQGLDAIPLFKQKWPGIKIIMLTILEDEVSIMKAIRNGADGYILKKASPVKILEGIQQVCDGGAALTPMVAKQVLAFFNPAVITKDGYSGLTPREREILSQIVGGLTNDQIAGKLFISSQTVRNHIKNIYEKLQVHSKAQAVAKALKDRIV